VAEVVAFAFGLAAASFFPVIVLGIFWKRANKPGAITGMSIGLAFTFIMITLMRAQNVIPGMEEPIVHDFLGIGAQGIGIVGMGLNFLFTVVVSLLTEEPPMDVQEMVESLRDPARKVIHRVEEEPA
ncbi:MAG TPA: cation acetate symporter, partial [Rhodothermales bacterium]